MYYYHYYISSTVVIAATLLISPANGAYFNYLLKDDTCVDLERNRI